MGTQVFRSRGRVLVGAITAVVAIGGAVGALVVGEASAGLAGLLLTLAWASWVALISPSVVLREGTATLTNRTRVVTLGTASVEDVEVGETLTIRAAGRRFASAALPGMRAPARTYSLDAMQQAGTMAMGAVGVAGPSRAVDPSAVLVETMPEPPGSSSPLQARVQRLLLDGRPATVAAQPPTARLRTGSLVVLALLVTATVIAYATGASIPL